MENMINIIKNKTNWTHPNTIAKKIVEEIKKGKKFEELNLKPFFRLHSPRKGIKSKLHYPKGVLGDHKDKINELLIRML